MTAGFNGYSVTLAKSTVHSETAVKQLLRDALVASDFSFHEEVAGTTWDGVKVKLDFWCYPKPNAIAKDWPAEWFGIEVKGYGVQDQRKKTCARLLWQAIRYRESSFPTPNGPTRPFLLLVLPPFLTILRDREQGDGAYATQDFATGYALGLAKVAAMFRVGELQLTRTGFDVYFHGVNCWWRGGAGRTGMDCLSEEDTHASR